MSWVRIPFRRGVLDTTLCNKGYQWLAIGWWFYPGASVSSTNKNDRHDITEILLKVALKHHNPPTITTNTRVHVLGMSNRITWPESIKFVLHQIEAISAFTWLVGWFMVVSAIFNNISDISWRAVLLVKEFWVPGENHRPIASNQTFWKRHAICIFDQYCWIFNLSVLFYLWPLIVWSFSNYSVLWRLWYLKTFHLSWCDLHWLKEIWTIAPIK